MMRLAFWQMGGAGFDPASCVFHRKFVTMISTCAVCAHRPARGRIMVRGFVDAL